MATYSDTESRIYQRIGEFVVSFQWVENKLREIGWFILDPDRADWPPKELRNLTNQQLINEVYELFKGALPKCKLDEDLESDFRTSFEECRERLHELRRDRNRILHSAFVELKAGGEVLGILRSNPKLMTDESTGAVEFDQEHLDGDSFDAEMRKMADAAMFLNRTYIQLIHRYPHGGV